MANNHSADEVTEGVAIVKTELRKTIQSRREAKGLGSVEMHDQEEKKSIEVNIKISQGEKGIPNLVPAEYTFTGYEVPVHQSVIAKL